MSFGKTLRYLRKKHNMTQTDLAQKLNLSKANISKYESDDVEPNIKTLNLLSEIFHVDIHYLIGDKIVASEPQIKKEEEIHSDEDYIFVIGSGGTRKKYTVPREKVERFKKLIEAGMPELFENDKNSDL